MDSGEGRGILKGIVIVLSILFLVIITYFFSEGLIKYSGITTFY